MVPVGETKMQKASKINVQLGIGYYQRNNLEQANAKLVKALRQNPASSQAHHAYAVLQNRFLEKEKAEKHFKKAIELDPENSEALTNYGAFLCADGHYLQAEKMFLQAVENPLYKTPEVAYTNAAVCLRKLKQDQRHMARVKKYLKKALGQKNNFPPALLNMAEISVEEKNYEFAKLYLDRYHQVARANPRSLWLAIQNELAAGHPHKATEFAQQLEQDFPDSAEYKKWQALEN
jgi:type IV pilus assembly protein PilF